MGEADEREVGESVGFNVLADLFEALVGGDEMLFAGRIDAVEARGDGGRTGDAHVDFSRASGPDHANDLSRSGAADDAVVDEDDALAFKQGPAGVELHADAKVADALGGFYEGAADIVIADEGRS